MQNSMIPTIAMKLIGKVCQAVKKKATINKLSEWVIVG